ncbi:uncharacterized protein LOC109831103, partial [Asparagus officinalis]|uniref:uncharacterized protein LOC109831103 n=1 Tax=Asparagus officinalis TaxID=4686 RepID=UPI00098E7859
ALFLTVAVYFHLWSIDSSFTSDDREILRRQFEQANLEAMDESADWRMKFDEQLERSKRYQEELLKVKGALKSAIGGLTMLRKENIDLLKQAESRRQHCNCRQSGT